MADDVNRLKIGMEGVAKAYGSSEKAARKMLAQFGKQVEAHDKIAAAIAKQLVGEKDLTKAITKSFAISSGSKKELLKNVKTKQEAVIVIQSLIKQEKDLAKAVEAEAKEYRAAHLENKKSEQAAANIAQKRTIRIKK